MSENIKERWKQEIEKKAALSGNREAFIQGIVTGLGQAFGLLRPDDPWELIELKFDTLLDVIEEEFPELWIEQ